MIAPVPSGGLTAMTGWALWLANQPWGRGGRGTYPAEAESSFVAGYELARSQSTQGSGFWNPETGAGS